MPDKQQKTLKQTKPLFKGQDKYVEELTINGLMSRWGKILQLPKMVT
jgi:hypothetical protein